MCMLVQHLVALLGQATDEDEIRRLVVIILAIDFYNHGFDMLRGRRNRNIAAYSAVLNCVRNEPSGAYDWKRSAIYYTIYWKSNELEFRRQFRMSRCAFEALLTDLSEVQENVRSARKLCTEPSRQASRVSAISRPCWSGSSFLARFPTLALDMPSSDPVIRREAYKNLLYHFKPRNFQ